MGIRTLGKSLNRRNCRDARTPATAHGARERTGGSGSRAVPRRAYQMYVWSAKQTAALVLGRELVLQSLVFRCGPGKPVLNMVITSAGVNSTSTPRSPR